MNINAVAKPGNGIIEPSNPYDAAAWAEFYAANPGYRRSVGAAGVNDDDDDNDNGDGGDGGNGDGGNGDGGDGGNGDGGNGGHKPSDKEAELLKDVMKQKAKVKEAAEKNDALQKQLDAFKDVDPVKYREMMDAAAKAEEQKLLDKGEFDKVKAQMTDAHEKALAAKDEENASLKEQNASLLKTINDLTIGAGFDQSKFIGDKTVLTSRKARVLYGSHFELKDGVVVGYDKPAGEEGRAPLVGADGEPVAFEDAIKRIVEADPDKDELLRASLKPGADSAPSAKKGSESEGAKQSSTDKISAGLGSLMDQMNKGGGIPGM